MIRTRNKKVLYVAPEVSSDQLTADYDNITRIHALDRIFPTIYQLSPNLVIFDYDYLSKDIERIVRRLRTNTFYSKIKICCYKSRSELKTDGLLKAIGVDYFIYEEELREAQKSNNISSLFTEIVDRSVVSMLIGAIS
jgi:hypothetical protein